jgi:diguanylate cyclase (GGDEF)-like protein
LHTFSQLHAKPAIAALWLRLKRLRTMGIAARLLFSFLAVAVLAATANVIAEHGVAVIRTTHYQQAPPLPTMTSPRLPAAPPPPAEQPPETPAIRRLPAIDADLMISSVQRYQRAVQVRTTIDSSESTVEAEAAAKNLDAASRKIRAAVDARGLGPTPLVSKAQVYEAAGADRIHIADARRRTIEDYVACADGMEQRLTKSLDGALKIFGRVLARQSLLQLHAQLDQVRHRFTEFSTGTGQPGYSDGLVAAETAFAATFNGNSTALSRSEGEPWVRQMRNDFSRIIDLRQSIGSLDIRTHDSADRFEVARARLTESIPKPLPASAETHRPVTRVRPSVHPTPPLPSPATMANAAAPVASPVDIITESRSYADARRTVAWITGAVLIVLLAVSALTVRSIVRPVSSMLAATERIANGDVDVRVAAGGIKELDILSMSFNRMAAQLAAARDMTRDYQQRLEEKVEQRTRQLQHLAEHDPLTHLPNRRQLFVLLNHALDRAAQNRRHVAVFFMDIDNFKNLNDSMGHAFGDQVLTGIARRLKETAQSFGFAGRLGGDEFTVVYEDAASVDVVEDAGRKLVGIFDQPLVIDGREVVVRASVGASVYPIHGSQAQDLLSAADAALFQAKALGRGQLAVFTPELLAVATRKFTIEQGLRRAIEHNEFELVFQPEVSLDSMEMVLVEALLRWRLPDGRQAPPAEFLPVTEESGLIVEVGNWVMRKAIETASHWHHGEWPEARVAINVSPRQLLDPRFVDNVQDLLREFDLPPECIELELTESVLQTGPTTIESLRRLRAHKIAIALDDFGTGYSTLASLENLPLTRIKLDRSLIASIDSSARSAAITTALIGLCKGLGLEITAEGIERAEQFSVLAEYRSLHLQGYLISKPIAADAVLQAKRMIPAIMQDLLLSEPTRRAAASGGTVLERSLASGLPRG